MEKSFNTKVALLWTIVNFGFWNVDIFVKWYTLCINKIFYRCFFLSFPNIVTKIIKFFSTNVRRNNIYKVQVAHWVVIYLKKITYSIDRACRSSRKVRIHFNHQKVYILRPMVKKNKVTGDSNTSTNLDENGPNE